MKKNQYRAEWITAQLWLNNQKVDVTLVVVVRHLSMFHHVVKNVMWWKNSLSLWEFSHVVTAVKCHSDKLLHWVELAIQLLYKAVHVAAITYIATALNSDPNAQIKIEFFILKPYFRVLYTYKTTIALSRRLTFCVTAYPVVCFFLVLCWKEEEWQEAPTNMQAGILATKPKKREAHMAVHTEAVWCHSLFRMPLHLQEHVCCYTNVQNTYITIKIFQFLCFWS